MIEYTVKVNKDGDKHWYLNGERHREDGPAIIWNDGTESWYFNDKLHREDGPAIEYEDGTILWYINGEELSEDEFNNRTKVELSLDEISKKFNIPLDKLRIKK